jgi:hypothetical protein
MYGSADIYERFSPQCGKKSWVEALGDGDAYKGSLLLAMETEILDSCAGSVQIESSRRLVTCRPAVPLIEVRKGFINGTRAFFAGAFSGVGRKPFFHL